jgi:hypothetical protein
VTASEVAGALAESFQPERPGLVTAGLPAAGPGQPLAVLVDRDGTPVVDVPYNTDLYALPADADSRGHRPEENCPCRKPAPGLVRHAAATLGVPRGSQPTRLTWRSTAGPGRRRPGR